MPFPVPVPVAEPIPFDIGNPMIGAPVLAEPFPFSMPMPFTDFEAGVEAETEAEMMAGHQKKQQESEEPAAREEEEQPAAREEEEQPAAREEEEQPAAREEEESAEAPHGKKFHAPRGSVSSKSRAAVRVAPRELKQRQLPDQLQQFFVPLTKNHVENVEQPIEQHVTQPFHQRILRQPVPQVQPYNTRVIQPVVQQTVQPMLSTSVETIKPAEAQYLEPIQNADVVLAARTSSRTEPLIAAAPRAEGKKSH